MQSVILWLSKCTIPPILRKAVLGCFSWLFNINLSECDKPLIHYKTINAFFTRAIHSDHRPINTQPHTVVSPVDGAILEHGFLSKGLMIQAKGLTYTLDQLLGSSMEKTFAQGSYMTIYLSPKDCHRVFSPVDCKVNHTHHIPGKQYMVRKKQRETIPGLYTKNERLIIDLSTDTGLVSLVMVAARNVGNMSLACDIGTTLNRGAWLSTFNLGSTVILLSETPIRFNTFNKEQFIRYGESLGSFHVT